MKAIDVLRQADLGIFSLDYANYIEYSKKDTSDKISATDETYYSILAPKFSIDSRCDCCANCSLIYSLSNNESEQVYYLILLNSFLYLP